MYRPTRRETFGLIFSGVTLTSTLEKVVAATTPRVRENIEVFAQDKGKVRLLRAGVQEMKRRANLDKDDPTGWYYWYASHATTDPVPANRQTLYNQCQHSFGTQATLFLPWHRAFLLYFEETLRAAAAATTGDDSLNLPYWNWYAAPDVPAIFTEGSAQTNPLWHPRQKTSVGGLDSAALKEHQLLEDASAAGFSLLIEGNPHGTVHGLIGGDMGVVQRSARDPIFWLHHANIDRLWAAWDPSGQMSAIAGWDKKAFVFDPDQKMSTTAERVSALQAIGYTYDDFSTPPTTVNATTVKVQSLQVPEATDASPETQAFNATGSAVTLGTASGLVLGDQSVSIRFAVPPSRGQAIEMIAKSMPGSIAAVELLLEQVQLGRDGKNGGFSYDVCINVTDYSLDYGGRCIAQLNTFSLSGAAMHGGMNMENEPSEFRLTIPSRLLVRDDGVLDTSNVSVAFLLSGATSGSGDDHQYLTIGKATLLGVAGSPK